MGTSKIIRTSFSTIWKSAKNKCMRTKTTDVFTESKNITTPQELPVDKFVKAPPKPPRELDSTDVYNFRYYLQGKKTDLKITPEEIKTLFSYEGKEFERESFEFFCKKLNITQELKPTLEYGNELKAPMAYDFIGNTIRINPDYANELTDKANFLALLRHEFQHYSQNIAMYRHETEGEKLVKIYANIGSKAVMTNVDKYAKTLNTQELSQIFDEEGMKEMMHLQDLLRSNKTKEYEIYLNTLQKEVYQNYITVLGNLRRAITDKFGFLKKESAEGKRAVKMIDETTSEYKTYWENDGSVNYVKYFSNIREIEALSAQDTLATQLDAIKTGKEKYCFLRVMAETQQKLKENVDSLDPQLQTLVNNEYKVSIKDLKEYLSIIFD